MTHVLENVIDNFHNILFDSQEHGYILNIKLVDHQYKNNFTIQTEKIIQILCRNDVSE